MRVLDLYLWVIKDEIVIVYVFDYLNGLLLALLLRLARAISSLICTMHAWMWLTRAAASLILVIKVIALMSIVTARLLTWVAIEGLLAVSTSLHVQLVVFLNIIGSISLLLVDNLLRLVDHIIISVCVTEILKASFALLIKVELV